MSIIQKNTIEYILQSKEYFSVKREKSKLYLNGNDITGYQSQLIKILLQTVKYLQKINDKQVKLIRYVYETLQIKDHDIIKENLSFESFIEQIHDFNKPFEDLIERDSLQAKLLLLYNNLILTLLNENEDFKEFELVSPFNKIITSPLKAIQVDSGYISIKDPEDETKKLNIYELNEKLKKLNTFLLINHMTYDYDMSYSVKKKQKYSSQTNQLSQIRIKNMDCKNIDDEISICIHCNNDLKQLKLDGFDFVKVNYDKKKYFNLIILQVYGQSEKFFNKFLSKFKSSEFILYSNNYIDSIILRCILYQNELLRIYLTKQQDIFNIEYYLKEIELVNRKYTNILSIILFDKLFKNNFSLFRIMYDLYEFDYKNDFFNEIEQYIDNFDDIYYSFSYYKTD